MQAAHGEGIIHRDLKPANLMVVDADTPYEKIKVMDFGLAKLLDEPCQGPVHKVSETGAEFAVGTPGYISPEQVRGEELDHRSDLYSVGVLLFEMLTGRLPFTGNETMDVLLAHATEAPPTFAEVGSGPGCRPRSRKSSRLPGQESRAIGPPAPATSSRTFRKALEVPSSQEEAGETDAPDLEQTPSAAATPELELPPHIQRQDRSAYHRPPHGSLDAGHHRHLQAARLRPGHGRRDPRKRPRPDPRPSGRGRQPAQPGAASTGSA